MKRLRIGFALGIVILVTACNGSATDAPPETESEESTEVTSEPIEAPIESAVTLPPTDEPLPAETPATVADASPAGPTCTSLYDGGVFDQELTELLNDDERFSGYLDEITSGWKTDWSRHTITYSEIIPGGPLRDDIPSIDDPAFVTFSEASNWLTVGSPVIVVEIGGEARAYPLAILSRHEIVNDTFGDIPVAITYCPLCNSALVFDTCINGEAVEFGVSGLLRYSDLLMYDRATESVWQQLTGQGVIGLHAGHQLGFIPSAILSYGDFRATYPDGVVLSRETGFYPPETYEKYPYAGYDNPNGRPTLYRSDQAPDPRLPAMLRVVGVVVDGVAVAYPYDLLGEQGVIQDTVNGQEIVVFHQFGTYSPFGTISPLGDNMVAPGEDVGATGVFIPEIDGTPVRFTLNADGEIVDTGTGSVWTVSGVAESGELEGTRLERYLSSDDFWFSWAAFYPETAVWEAE